MSMKVKVAGAWRNATSKVKVSGAWRNVKQAYVKVGGVWKTLFTLLEWDLTPYTPLTYYVLDQSKNISSQTTDSADGLWFKDDGTKMYVLTDNDRVYQYTLSPAWDVSSASYDNINLGSNGGIVPTTLFFKYDGSELYICDSDISEIQQFSLSTPWDLSTATFHGSAVIPDIPRAMLIKYDQFYSINNGVKCYIASGGFIYPYTLSTPWDITTISKINGVSYDFSSVENNIKYMQILPSGFYFYLAGTDNNTLYEFILSPIWQLSDANNLSLNGFYPLREDTSVSDFLQVGHAYFSTSERKFYALDGRFNGNIIYGYNVGSFKIGEYMEPLTTKTLDVSTESGFFNRGITISSDGSKLYMCKLDSGNDLFQYTLSTPFDVNTATFNTAISVSSGADLASIDFKPDGTELYAMDNISSFVFFRTYSLSTPWDIGTASLINTSPNITSPNAREFRIGDNGFKFFIIKPGSSSFGDDIQEFSISSSYNFSSTITLLDTFLSESAYSGLAGGSAPSLDFKTDGTKMYVLADGGYRHIKQYDLSTPWDLSTASYNGAFYRALTNTGPSVESLKFASDGGGFYVLCDSTGSIYQYNP